MTDLDLHLLPEIETGLPQRLPASRKAGTLVPSLVLAADREAADDFEAM